jgi:hypothetical protein
MGGMLAVLPEALDFVGPDVYLRFKKGQLILIRVLMLNENGTIQDITGRTYSAKLGDLTGATVATFSSSIVGPGANGTVEFSLDTSAIGTLDPGQYVVEAWEDSNKNHIWAGPVEVVAKLIN